MKRIQALILSVLLVFALLTLCCGSAFALTASPAAEEREIILSGNPLVADDAGLLSASELQALEQKAKNISSAHSCEVIILTVNDAGGKSPQDYAEDYYTEEELAAERMMHEDWMGQDIKVNDFSQLEDR